MLETPYWFIEEAEGKAVEKTKKKKKKNRSLHAIKTERLSSASTYI